MIAFAVTGWIVAFLYLLTIRQQDVRAAEQAKAITAQAITVDLQRGVIAALKQANAEKDLAWDMLATEYTSLLAQCDAWVIDGTGKPRAHARVH